MTDLLPCPFCAAPVQFRKALWPSEGDCDGIIHVGITACPMSDFSNGTVDESILAVWNTRPGLAQLPVLTHSAALAEVAIILQRTFGADDIQSIGCARRILAALAPGNGAVEVYTQQEMDEADKEADEIHKALFAPIPAALDPVTPGNAGDVNKERKAERFERTGLCVEEGCTLEDTSDIVDSLRDRAKAAREEHTGTADGDANHFERAASEIERLRSRPAVLDPGTVEACIRTVALTMGMEPSTAGGPIFDAMRALIGQISGSASSRVSSTESAWQPIETAPKNHFPILLYGEYGMLIGFQDVTWEWLPYPADMPLGYVPTHWMPLPAKPSPVAQTVHTQTFIQCTQCWQPATCKKYGCRAASSNDGAKT